VVIFTDVDSHFPNSDWQPSSTLQYLSVFPHHPYLLQHSLFLQDPIPLPHLPLPFGIIVTVTGLVVVVGSTVVVGLVVIITSTVVVGSIVVVGSAVVVDSVNIVSENFDDSSIWNINVIIIYILLFFYLFIC